MPMDCASEKEQVVYAYIRAGSEWVSTQSFCACLLVPDKACTAAENAIVVPHPKTGTVLYWEIHLP